MAKEPKLLLSSSPYIHSGRTTQFAMWAVVGSLLPALAVATYLFGYYVLLLTAMTCIGAVLAEWAAIKMRGQQWTGEVSSLVTGCILALTLPPQLPLWIGFVGGAIS